MPSSSFTFWFLSYTASSTISAFCTSGPWMNLLALVASSMFIEVWTRKSRPSKSTLRKRVSSASVFSSVSVPVFEFSAPFGLFVRVAQEVTGISIARIKDSAIIRLEKQESIVYTPSDNYLQPYHFMAINVIAIITLI